MTVRLTTIYTRTGDDGSTGLADFSRVPKTEVRIGALADVDETNATLGAVLALCSLPDHIAAVLLRLQNELFDLGADLATPIAEPQRSALRIDQSYIDRLEHDCDTANADLPALTSFVLPGGTPAAALLHVARTTARRAERSAWALIGAEGDFTNPATARYLNRLADLLFILARAANPDGDVLWKPGGER